MSLPFTREAEPAPATIRVLFADDSAAIRTLARFALSSRHGFEVVAEATDGDEALRQFDGCRPDCVVLDIEMPGTDGLATLAELQRRAPRVPVVMLSGSTDPETRRRAFAEGAAAYLGKGELTQLAATIRSVAGRSPSAPVPAPADSSPATVVSGEPQPQPSQDRPSRTQPSRVPPVPGADQAAADLRRLEYLVSHDFAEPARIMKGFASLLAAGHADALDERGQAFLGHITAASDRLQAMIDDLLVFSRAGRAEPRLGRVEAGECLTEATRALAAMVTERHATLEVQPLPAVVADPTALTTVLRQVVANGIVFNRSPVPTVWVDGEVTAGEAVLRVRDNGIGVPVVEQENVFELFRRLNTREEFPGTGTGLTLCRRLMTQQGGTILLRPAPQGGTVVTLSLPTD